MLFEAKYKHWPGRYRDVWYRRCVIAGYAMRAAFQAKSMRVFLTLAWALVFVQTAILFLLGRLLVEDSIIFVLLRQAHTQVNILASGLVQWLVTHPEISVRTTYMLIFYFFSMVLAFPAYVVLGLAIPRMISTDLASKAILVYSSKALNRFDYVFGKFLALFGLTLLAWLGPLCAAWFLGNLMSPDWHFFWHSRMALLKSALFVSISAAILSLIGLGVSAISKRPGFSFGLWLIFWAAPAAFLVRISLHTEPWLKHLSFSHNIKLLGRKIFAMHQELALARDNVPMLGQMIDQARAGDALFWQEPQIGAALTALAIMVATAMAILWMRVRPE